MTKLLSKTEILGMADKYTPTAGVYFLISEGEIVYVGQSIDVVNRIASHALKGEKTFDQYTYVEVDPDNLSAVEADYIVTLNPRLNGPNLPCYQTWVSLKFLARLLRDTPYTMNHVNRYIAENGIRDCNGFYRRSDFDRFTLGEKQP